MMFTTIYSFIVPLSAEDINKLFSVKPLIALLYEPMKNSEDCLIGVRMKEDNRLTLQIISLFIAVLYKISHDVLNKLAVLTELSSMLKEHFERRAIDDLRRRKL